MAEPIMAQKAPYVVEVEPKQYSWCACGRSQRQPYCDGSHKGTGMGPVREQITEQRRVAWCGCKKTGTPPFCDGTHSTLD
ncbi:MAG: CDGSH iron-sulfur domain-containing protein [Deltaproteobacteria bacterium]|nr:CDGSH iron-sulfur domain-containing protein [Deltaproteobacteria bacterium]